MLFRHLLQHAPHRGDYDVDETFGRLHCDPPLVDADIGKTVRGVWRMKEEACP